LGIGYQLISNKQKRSYDNSSPIARLNTMAQYWQIIKKNIDQQNNYVFFRNNSPLLCWSNSIFTSCLVAVNWIANLPKNDFSHFNSNNIINKLCNNCLLEMVN